MEKQTNEPEVYRTFEEYKRAFFPIASRQERPADPYEAGLQSGREALESIEDRLADLGGVLPGRPTEQQ